MGDSLDHERPAKRIKLGPVQQQQHQSLHHSVFMPPPPPPPVNISMGSMSMAAAMVPATDPWGVAVGAAPSAFDAPWPPPPASASASASAAASLPSQLFVTNELVPYGSARVDAHVSWAAPVTAAALGPAPVPDVQVAVAAPTAPDPDPTPSSLTEMADDDGGIAPVSTPSATSDFNLSPADRTSSHLNPPAPRQFKQSHLPRPLPSTATGPPSALPSHAQEQRRRKLRSTPPFVSPFKDCLGSFGKLTSPRFSRPSDGKVNGYIKFHWPERKSSSTRSSSTFAVTECNDDEDDEAESTQSSSIAAQSSSALTVTHYYHRSPESSASTLSFQHSSVEADFVVSYTSRTPPSSQSSARLSDAYATPTELVPARRASHGGPRMVPPQFGLLAKMDHMDRQFWTFYIMNWCPGRSVLGRTNLWLTDFAKMHESDGVRAAIQSLAGIYIYDYQPMDVIRRRTNHRFAIAEGRLSSLLRNPASLNDDEASELITIASILSMQDIVLIERRLKRPHHPRWLQGFRQSEHFLEATDQGCRFWLKNNVQLSSLRISQSIIVGRAVILSQPMMELPPSREFDPEHEAARFGWLLYGTQQDVYEIHGGCGFSKKLLHVISQITYCAARLQQDNESPVVPLTIRYLLGELVDMRQWSSESRGWGDAKAGPQIIEWVRAVPEGYFIDSSPAMTDVTAEAWRFAAIIYLQCRALRLPRNHPEVLANLTDLAKCIRIMPTSGTHFTAQAPLFPVFLLGMLASIPDHREVSENWFERVVSTPVRSSVPPLYEVLQRIWTWIDSEPNFSPPADYKVAEQISKRHPWWEHLVQQVQDGENEVLCLT